METEGIQALLKNLWDFSSLDVKQEFLSNESNKSLSVQCFPDSKTFLISDVNSNQLWQSNSLEETAQFISKYLRLHE